jgi:hypothetical protein
MRSERKAPKNGEQRFGFSFTTMLQHIFRFLKDFLAKNKVTTLLHPPYSPDLDTAGIYLFPRVKSAVKGRRFCGATDIIKNATEELKRFSQNSFHEFFRNL